METSAPTYPLTMPLGDISNPQVFAAWVQLLERVGAVAEVGAPALPVSSHVTVQGPPRAPAPAQMISTAPSAPLLTPAMISSLESSAMAAACASIAALRR